jgi:hypothetical protein
MKDTFHIRVRFDRLAPRLERTVGRRMSNGDVLQWLIAFGFWTKRGGLYGSRSAMALLEPDEIISSERVVGRGGTNG